MKRDFELIRKILHRIEESDSVRVPVDVVIEGYTEEQVTYHLLLLAQANLIDAEDYSGADDVVIAPMGLTWDGHEFLDSIKNETVWQKTQQAVKEKGGSVSFEILKVMAAGYAKGLFGV